MECAARKFSQIWGFLEDWRFLALGQPLAYSQVAGPQLEVRPATVTIDKFCQLATWGVAGQDLEVRHRVQKWATGQRERSKDDKL